jgi:CheY-like chemotaxis protein
VGYSVTLAASADEALRVLDQNAEAMTCVLLDLTMPGQDGSEAFTSIRQRYPKLPVIFMSGYESRSVPAANGFLHKPFTMKQLRQVMQNVLGEPAVTHPPDPSR